MCDFSLQSVRSRPAKVSDKLVTRDFGTGTRGFSAAEDLEHAVCVMPGTELALAGEVACLPAGLWVEDEDHQPPDGHLSTSQQGQVGRASRCDRISGWADRDAYAPVRGSGGNSAPTACAASDRVRGGCPEARHLRGLKLRTNLCRPRPMKRPTFSRLRVAGREISILAMVEACNWRSIE